MSVRNIDVYIETVGSVFSWAEPAVIGGLFLDNEDYKGLIYWYEVAKKLHPTPKN